jgi:formylglycine-generating enzyme required for sulfatase activity
MLATCMAQTSRTLMEFHGVTPGESRIDSLRAGEWNQLVSQSTAADGTRHLEFHIAPWKKVVVVAKGDRVVGIDLFPPRGLTGQKACDAFGLGRVMIADQLPPEARFATEGIAGTLYESEATFVLIEMEDQDGLQRVRRLRFFGNRPLPAGGTAEGGRPAPATQPDSSGQPPAPLAVAGVIQAMQPDLSGRPPAAVVSFNAQQARAYQEAWAKYLGQPVEMTNSIGMRLTLIPPGEFVMGSTVSAAEIHRRFPGGRVEWYEREHPPHKVRITRPYYLGTHEVSVADFERFVTATGYKTTAEKEGNSQGYQDGEWKAVEGLNWRRPGFAQQSTHPVTCVSWDDAVAFCQWLSQKEGRTYRLPTEAEWECACRAGTDTLSFWGDDPDAGEGYLNAGDETGTPSGGAWMHKFGFRDRYVTTSPVGRFKPNAFGLHDMLGNVAEWCSDCYGGYASTAVADPTGPTMAPYRVVRGGGWSNCAGLCRSAYRNGSEPANRGDRFGFRVTFSPTAATGK